MEAVVKLIWFKMLQTQSSAFLASCRGRGNGVRLILHAPAAASEDGVTTAWAHLFHSHGVGG